MNTESLYADWAVLFVHSPGQGPEFGGVFLLDGRDQILYFKLKDKLASTDQTVIDLWGHMATELNQRIADYGGTDVLAWLETMSNTFRLNDRHQILHRDKSPAVLLEQLYLAEVQK